MPSFKGDPSTTRALNRQLILNRLRAHGPLTRTQLVEHTGLSAAAVTFVTTELLEEGLLVETTERRPIPLDIHYSQHFVVGLKLMEDRLEAVLTDLSTRAIDQVSVQLPDHLPPTVAHHTRQVKEALCLRNQVPEDRLLGLGLGLPGVIDGPKGLCLHSRRFGWENVPIGPLLQEATGCPVWVDNDLNAFAAAERLFGRGKQAQNFVVVTVGRGVGAGLVLGGRIYRGRNGGAGEFGHTLSEHRGRLCECGRLGCLEAYVSEQAVVARFQEISPRHQHIDLQGFLQLVQEGNPRATTILEDAGDRFGRNLADLINLFNPELVVIGGEGVRVGEVFFASMHGALQERTFDCGLADLPIFIDHWGDDAWARGAAGLAIEHFFDLQLKSGS